MRFITLRGSQAGLGCSQQKGTDRSQGNGNISAMAGNTSGATLALSSFRKLPLQKGRAGVGEVGGGAGRVVRRRMGSGCFDTLYSKDTRDKGKRKSGVVCR